jgi:hypothetical protein
MEDEDGSMDEDPILDILFMELDEIVNGLRQAILPGAVLGMINQNNFRQLQEFFQDERNAHRVNYCVDNQRCAMTSLEHAVRLGNWQLACFLLYALGADPQHNQYDGIFRSMACLLGLGPSDNIKGFQEELIPGF